MNRSIHLIAGLATLVAVSGRANAQANAPRQVATAARDTAPAAPAPAVSAPAAPAPAALPPIDFSGVVFGNFQYHGEPGAAASNKFDLERAYLTFKLPIADHVTLRATLDVSPQQSGTGYVVRQKYAYAQYDFGVVTHGVKALARIGELHTVAIDHMETFWPRWLTNTAVEKFGFFSSADVGASTLVTLPEGRGEVYAVITNGAGYSKPESDRFKSYAARATWAPFPKATGFWKTAALSLWGESNAAASKFVAGGAGQVGPVGDGLRRDRFGIFAGVRDPRLTVGVETGGRVDATEAGANTPASPRTVRDVRGGLTSAFAIVRPFDLAGAKVKLPVSLVARVDSYRPDGRSTGRAQFVDAGLVLDVVPSRKTQLAFDYQALTSDATVTGFPTTQVYSVRFVTSF